MRIVVYKPIEKWYYAHLLDKEDNSILFGAGKTTEDAIANLKGKIETKITTLRLLEHFYMVNFGENQCGMEISK